MSLEEVVSAEAAKQLATVLAAYTRLVELPEIWSSRIIGTYHMLKVDWASEYFMGIFYI